ncbi:MAG: ribonuclease D [Flavobacteriales bacterium]|nr:ribonuclease D [Flavobacteriales bacterium]
MASAYTLITRHEDLSALMERLSKEPIVALDTEASSFHRYTERICLIQLSTRDTTWLVDPLALPDLEPLGKALAGAGTEWVIHDADYDLRMLKRAGGHRVLRVFDTMVAAELLNEPELGLAANLNKHFGVTLDKRFQKADWSKRPLPEDMLAYAAMDTTYLIGLRDILKKKLEDMGRWSWAEEEFAHLVGIPYADTGAEEPGFLRIKGAKVLKPRQLAVLRELHAWRDSLAERLDRAPFMVLGNDTLIDLSKDPPADMAELGKRKGVGENALQRNGAAIMKAIQHGLALPKEEWPRLERPKRYERDDDYEERLKRLKIVREELMVEHELRPGIVCPNYVLADIARLLPKSMDELTALPGLRNWQVKEFGARLLSVL